MTKKNSIDNDLKVLLQYSQNTIRAIDVAAAELLTTAKTKKEFNKRIDALLSVLAERIIK